MFYFTTDPAIVSNISSNFTSYVGKRVTLKCNGDGNPPPEYSWKTPDNQTITGNSTLVLSLHSSQQFGVYSCTVINVHGKDDRDVTLRQLGWLSFFTVMYSPSL